MAVQVQNTVTDEPAVVVRERVYASVEEFAATEDHPQGINGIVALDPDSGDWQLVVAREEVTRQLRLAHCWRRLAFLDGDKEPRLWIVDRPWDSLPERIACLSGYASFAMSASGEEFFVSLRGPAARSAGRAGVWRFADCGSEWARLPLSEDEPVHDCSPDGKWLLVGDGKVKLATPDGTDRRDLSPPEEKCIRPRFSPDGRHIVYASATHDGESLWITDIEGRDRRLLLPESPVTIVACWSPNGSRLALKLCDCVRGPQGWVILPRDDLSLMRPRIEIIDVDSSDRHPLDLPLGRILLGGWG